MVTSTKIEGGDMGSQISRIEKEFVLNTVLDKQMELRLHGNQVEGRGQIERIDEDTIVVSTASHAEERYSPGSSLRVYFSYYGHVMTFISKVRTADASSIRIDYPDAVHKNLERKYVRVPAPSNSTVSFSIQETKVELSFPKTEEYDPVELPDVDADFDMDNLETLVDQFRENAKKYADTNKIIMFRERRPSGLEEQLIAQSGKILFIPNTAGRFPENDYQIGGKIITRAMLLQNDRMDLDEDISQDRLPALLSEKRKSGIRAELYCPIIFHEYVVGYVYLSQKKQDKKVFDHDLLDYTYQFSKVLAYTLKTTGYFKGQIPDEGEHTGEIIDISASGLLFASSSQRLQDLLTLYTDLDLTLTFGDRVMRVVGRVMRTFESKDMYYFGIQYMEIKPEDFRYLFELVYGRAVTSEDEELWEGGTEPPELDLG